MQPIVTFTVNPALDMSTEVERVEAKHKLRCGPAVFDPGGGGINVARVVHRLGGNALALYAVGGPTGRAFEELLEREGVEGCPLPIEGSTRLNVTVDETSTGDQYRFVVEGPALSEAEWRRALDILAGRITEGSYVVASGSLPPGVPDDLYARVARLCRERRAHCVVDTSGPALRAALDEGVYLVKPNRRELQQLLQSPLTTAAEEEQAAQAIVARGESEAVALTLGSRGSVLAWRGGIARNPPLEVETRSAVGAGDSFVGALVLRLAQGRPLPEAFRYASAAGAAALMTPATELCRKADVDRLYEQTAAAG
jgi:6-phosphofructokinase 2